MKTKIILLVFIGLTCFSYNLFADSPLTSIDISAVYQNEPIIIKASKTNGVLTVELMDYLVDKNNTIEFKIALISKLGWDVDNKNNSLIFYQYLNKNSKYKSPEEFLNHVDWGTLICTAYLKALDNYLNVDDAIILARRAKEKNKSSYTVNIICALIEAQKALADDWCEVYKLTNNVRLNKSLKSDMKEEARKIIFEYMDLYKNDCQNKKELTPQITKEKVIDSLIVLYKLKKWGELIKLAEDNLNISNKEHGLLLMLAEAYAGSNNFEKAIYNAEKVIEKDPSNYYALLYLGNYHFFLDKLDLAEYYYIKVLNINPYYARANINLAKLYETQNKKEKAIKQYLNAIAQFEENNFKDEVITYSKEILKLDSNNKLAKEYLSGYQK